MTEERIDGEETKEKKKPKKSLKRELMEDVIMIVFVLVTVWVMKNYVLINAVIPSASMEDTIMTGDCVISKTDREISVRSFRLKLNLKDKLAM